MELLAFLTKQEHFSDEECRIIEESFTRVAIPKSDIIQLKNRFSEHLLFIESGLLRIFYYKEGKDITHFFFDENYFLAPINSIIYNKTERYEWEALEACQIRVIKYADFLNLCEQIPKLSQLMLEYTLKLLDLFSYKLNLLQFEKAFDRYQIFLEMYPNLLNRVSLGNTASFLGVTPQTISVIRAQKK